MKALTVEWVFDDRLLSEDDGFTVQEMAEAGRLPVVRLPDVDAVIQEAVWAMEIFQSKYFSDTGCCVGLEQYERAQAFLASPLVAAWRARQKKEHTQ